MPQGQEEVDAEVVREVLEAPVLPVLLQQTDSNAKEGEIRQNVAPWRAGGEGQEAG